MFHLAAIWGARAGHAVRLVSANDHRHSAGSAHYAGLALDLHASDPGGLAAFLTRAGYLVLWNVPGHYAHVHVEATRAVARAARALAPAPPRAPTQAAASPSQRRAPWGG
jgi:hypothetical protein